LGKAAQDRPVDEFQRRAGVLVVCERTPGIEDRFMPDRKSKSWLEQIIEKIDDALTRAYLYLSIAKTLNRKYRVTKQHRPRIFPRELTWSYQARSAAD
jgi:hypothetical protein